MVQGRGVVGGAGCMQLGRRRQGSREELWCNAMDTDLAEVLALLVILCLAIIQPKTYWRGSTMSRMPMAGVAYCRVRLDSRPRMTAASKGAVHR